jgi:hypothetical protein
MGAIAGKIGSIYMKTSASATAFTTEACTNASYDASIVNSASNTDVSASVTSDATDTQILLKNDGTWTIGNVSLENNQVMEVVSGDVWFGYCKLSDDSVGRINNVGYCKDSNTKVLFGDKVTGALEIGYKYTATETVDANFMVVESTVGLVERESQIFINMTAVGIETYTEGKMLEIAREIANPGKTYYITDTTKRYWDKATVPTVYVDAVEESGVTIDYIGGRITFDTPLAGTEAVTVTGEYWTVTELAGFYNWSLDLNADLEDATTFADSGWRTFVQTLKGFTISAEAYWQDETFLDRLGEEVVIALYVNEENDTRYEGFAYITTDAVETPVEGLVQDSVEFTGSGELYFYQ